MHGHPPCGVISHFPSFSASLQRVHTPYRTNLKNKNKKTPLRSAYPRQLGGSTTKPILGHFNPLQPISPVQAHTSLTDQQPRDTQLDTISLAATGGNRGVRNSSNVLETVTLGSVWKLLEKPHLQLFFIQLKPQRDTPPFPFKIC